LRMANRDELREVCPMLQHNIGTVDDVNRANAQSAEEVFEGWQNIPRLERRKNTLNTKLLPMFGASGQGVEFDYDDPSPDNREEDNLELTAKATAAQILVSAGFDPSDVLEVVGLPDMDVVEKATQEPALPPAWVPAPPAAPGGPDDAGPVALLRVYDAGKHGGGPRKQGKKKKKAPKPAGPPATVPGKQWIADAGACTQCLANADDGAIPTGALFDGGVVAPPQHPHCRCDLDDVDVPAPSDPSDMASGEQLAALFRRVLSDGYVPVQTGRR